MARDCGVELDEVSKVHGELNYALRKVSLRIEPGEFIALVGPSGCGKSTLLQLIGGMDQISTGRIKVGDTVISELKDSELSTYRRSSIGFVFQAFNLLPTLSVLENISLPLELNNVSQVEVRNRVARALERVNLSDKGGRYPHQLSGGEQQRVAVARAIVHRPRLLLADEPTGNLDSVNGAQVLELIAELHRELGSTVILATHSNEASSIAERSIKLRDGALDS